MKLAVTVLLCLPLRVMAGDSPRHCGKGSAPRTEPCIAAAGEQLAIMDHVNEALRIAKTLNNLRDAEAYFRVRADARDAGFEDLEYWRKSMDALQTAESEMRRNFVQAISLTQSYYGVGPKHQNGIIPDGPLKGALAGWSPAFQENARIVLATRRPGRNDFYVEYQPDGDSYSKTLMDGQVLVTPETFKNIAEANNPALLAVVLQMEAARFDELVTNGWKTQAIVDSVAYGKAADTARELGLPREIRDAFAANWGSSG